MSVALNIQALIEEMAQIGREAMSEAERQAQAEEEARQEAERRRIEEQWQPILATIKQTLPEWMHGYLQQPGLAEPVDVDSGYYHKVFVTPVILALPGLSPIHIYTQGDDVHFDVPTPSADLDDYADAGQAWYVRWSRVRAERFEIGEMGTDVTVAVALAQSAAAALAVAEAEVQRCNAAAQLEAEKEIF